MAGEVILQVLLDLGKLENTAYDYIFKKSPLPYQRVIRVDQESFEKVRKINIRKTIMKAADDHLIMVESKYTIPLGNVTFKLTVPFINTYRNISQPYKNGQNECNFVYEISRKKEESFENDEQIVYDAIIKESL